MDRWVSTFHLRRSRAHKLIQNPLRAECKKQNLKCVQESWVQLLPLTRFLGSAESLVSFLGLLQSDLSRGGLLSRVRLGRSRVSSTRAMWHLRGSVAERWECGGVRSSHCRAHLDRLISTFTWQSQPTRALGVIELCCDRAVGPADLLCPLRWSLSDWPVWDLRNIREGGGGGLWGGGEDKHAHARPDFEYLQQPSTPT